MGKVSKSSSHSSNEKKPRPKSPDLVNFILDHYVNIAKAFGILASVIVAYMVFKGSNVAMLNLMNVETNTLSTALLSKSPHLFICHRGGRQDGIPTILSDLHSILNSKLVFALVNCSQVLPSGKNLWERFKLKKEWKPSVFVTSPWGKPQQILPTSFKDVKTLRKSVENYIKPRATEVVKDSDLTKVCGKAVGINPTCLVLVKGKKYNNQEHSALEEKLLLSYPTIPVVSLDGQNRRLSFEDSTELPYDLFAMRIHALRRNTHYISMEYPLKWENIQAFVDHALSTSIDRYFFEKDKEVKIVKPAAQSFKQRIPIDMNQQQQQQQKSSSEGVKPDTRNQKQSDQKKESNDKTEDPEVDSKEQEQRRQQKEKERRMKMEKEEQEYLFNENEGSQEASPSQQDSEEEDDVIEL